MTQSPFDQPRVLSVGDTIGSYELVGKLGEGGMGSVFLAHHTRLHNKPVALKVLKADRGGKLHAISRFEREMKALGSIDHDNVVRATDAGEVDGVQFLVMELISGIDLGQILRNGALPFAESCEIIRQAALGIGHAHSRQLVHRDVKPTNLMLTTDGVVKLMDLGLAQLQIPSSDVTGLTQDGQRMGTFKYMAPEQVANSRSVDARCDIYALGITFIELLAGSVNAHRINVPQYLEVIRQSSSQTPEALLRFIEGMVADSVEQRFGSAEQIAEVLKPLAEGADLPKLVSGGASRELRPDSIPTFASTVETDFSAMATKVAYQSSEQTKNNGLGWKILAITSTCLVVVLLLAVIKMSLSGNPAEVAGAAGKEAQSTPENDGEPDKDKTLNEIAQGSDTGESQRNTSTKPVLDFPFQYPKIPSQQGAWVEWSGVISCRSITETNLVGNGGLYTITLRRLANEVSEQPADNRQLCWLELTIASQGNYSEHAYLLVDAAQFNTVRHFKVDKGWVWMETPRDQADVREAVGETLVVEFDPEVDTLHEAAHAWGIPLTSARLKIQDVLVLLFGGNLTGANADILALRSSLASEITEREIELKEYSGPLGRNIASAVIQPKDANVEQMPATDEEWINRKPTYKIQRCCNSEDTPFSFLRIDIASPLFTTALGVNNYGASASRTFAASDLTRLANDLTNAVVPKRPPFTHASIPDTVGAQVRYAGSLKKGPAKVLFDATAKALNSVTLDGRRHIWLEVSTASGEEGVGQRTMEKAWLLVDVQAYKEGKGSLKRGWVQFEGLTFEFVNGNLGIIREGMQLAKVSTQARLGVDEFMTLLFGMNIEGVGNLNDLRSRITSAIVKSGTDRKRIRDVVTLQSGEQLQCDVWQVVRSPNGSLSYNIARNEQVPFGFVRVELTLAHLALAVEAVSFDSSNEPLKFAESTLKDQKDVTYRRLEEQDIRLWNLSNADPQVRRFAIYQKSIRANVTWSTASGVETISWWSLSSEDRRWIVERYSRDWQTKNGKKFKAIYNDHRGNTIQLIGSSGWLYPSYGNLTTSDQTYIQKIEKNEKR